MAIYFSKPYYKEEKDANEFPSNLFENFAWEEHVLERISGNYKKNTSMPKDLLNELINSRMHQSCIHCLWQIIYGLFDHRIHQYSYNEVDIIKCFADTK